MPLPHEQDPAAEDIAACDKAIAGVPDGGRAAPELLIIRGTFHWNANGDGDRAHADLAMSEHGDRNLAPAARFLRATTWLTMGQWDRSIRDLDRLIAEDPSCGPCYRQRAIAHQELGRAGPALDDLLAARRQGVDDLDQTIEEVRRSLGR